MMFSNVFIKNSFYTFVESVVIKAVAGCFVQAGLSEKRLNLAVIDIHNYSNTEQLPGRV